MNSRKLSILHLMSARAYVGEAARVAHLAGMQRSAGHEVLVVARGGYEVAGRLRAQGVPVETASFGSRFHPLRDLADVRLLRRLVRERAVDVLHVHRGKDHALAAVARLGLRGSPLLVRTRHVVTPVRDHRANRWLYLRAADGLVCASRAVAAALRASFPGRELRLEVIEGGADLEGLRIDGEAARACLVRELGLEGGERVLACVARLSEVKGQLHALEAFARILAREPRALLVFASNRAARRYAERLRERARELGIAERVRWLGELENVGALLSLSDIGLVTSIGSEGWSRVAVEYAAAGLPTVATRVGSLPEIVEDGRTGLLVEPRADEALAGAVLRLLEDEPLRRRMGDAARKRATRYGRDRLAREVLALYARLLEERAARTDGPA